LLGLKKKKPKPKVRKQEAPEKDRSFFPRWSFGESNIFNFLQGQSPISAILGLGMGVGSTFLPIKTETMSGGKYSVCFTPSVSGCANLISSYINSAKRTIYVQAYTFTSADLAESLIRAKRRGVKVSIILDKTQKADLYSQCARFIASKINVVFDPICGIAHNKVMIIDQRYVVTGSYNFTKGAETRNAENVLVFDDKHLAAKYFSNWNMRYLAAEKKMNKTYEYEKKYGVKVKKTPQSTFSRFKKK
jgi:phospholipase D